MIIKIVNLQTIGSKNKLTNPLNFQRVFYYFRGLIIKFNFPNSKF